MSGRPRSELHWAALSWAWLGLVWLGLVCPGLAWSGLGWARTVSDFRQQEVHATVRQLAFPRQHHWRWGRGILLLVRLIANAGRLEASTRHRATQRRRHDATMRCHLPCAACRFTGNDTSPKLQCTAKVLIGPKWCKCKWLFEYPVV